MGGIEGWMVSVVVLIFTAGGAVALMQYKIKQLRIDVANTIKNSNKGDEALKKEFYEHKKKATTFIDNSCDARMKSLGDSFRRFLFDENMMPKVMPVMLERVEQRIPMPDYMKEQMPVLMPKVMENLMPHMIGDVVPLVTQPMIDYLQGKNQG